MKDQENLWAHAADHFQSLVSDSWTQALAGFQNLAPAAGAAGPLPTPPKLNFTPEKLQEVQQQYLKEAAELLSQGALAHPSASGDKRFSSEAWDANPVAAFTAALYLLNSRALLAMTDAVESDAKTRNRLRFAWNRVWPLQHPATSWRSMPRPRKKPLKPRAKALPKACKTCCTMCARAMCP